MTPSRSRTDGVIESKHDYRHNNMKTYFCAAVGVLAAGLAAPASALTERVMTRFDTPTTEFFFFDGSAELRSWVFHLNIV